MKTARFTVPWPEGLHLRPAAELVKLAQRFQSALVVTCNGRIADARSIANVLLLAATGGSQLAFEASGTDEDLVIQELARLFRSCGASSAGA